jgi:hypothetical protein
MSTEIEITEDAQRMKFRESVLTLQSLMKRGVEEGKFEESDCPLRHYFSPVDEKYGCCAYAREIFLPKGNVVIGKIHRHAHLNFIMKGKVLVATEFGEERLEAPHIFVSQPGAKRALYVEEDTIWVTVHLTKHNGEECLGEIENEVIAKTYEDIGLISHVRELLEEQ